MLRQTRLKGARRAALALCLLVASSCVLLGGRLTSHAATAERLKSEGRYLEAIAEYRLHLADRLEKKETAENPYFYLLLIGDCYLALDQLAEAERHYLQAQHHQVDPALVAERLRRLADWHEQRGSLEAAIEILSRYRNLDPLLFDLEIDRLHKAFIRQQETGASSLAPSSL